MSIRAWTDHPIPSLGDEEGELAPIRDCLVTGYSEGNVEVKLGTCYSVIPRERVFAQYGRVDTVPPLSQEILRLHFAQERSPMQYFLTATDGTQEWVHEFELPSDEMANEYAEKTMRRMFSIFKAGELWRGSRVGTPVLLSEFSLTASIHVLSKPAQNSNDNGDIQ